MGTIRVKSLIPAPLPRIWDFVIADPSATWIEEALSYSVGNGRMARWIERWLLDPLLRPLVRRHSGRAFRCLAERLAELG
jgi:hypothetical protein